MRRTLGTAFGLIVILVVVPLAAMGLAVVVTPAETVTVAGQTVEVGATPALSLRGPGEVDLFGATLPTRLEFSGPIRPRARWSQISNYDALTGALRQPQAVGDQLVAAWQRYFIHEAVVAALLAALLGALCLALLRRRTRVLIAGVVAAALLGGVVDGIAIAAVSGSVQRIPEQVQSLDDLVGRGPLGVVAPAPAVVPGPVDAVVIGDSTAAGAGNAPLASPSREDTACRRSADAFALEIARVDQWNVLNLACTNATITDGLFGVQTINGSDVPPQLARLASVTSARVVIVSIGANEMHWRNAMELCLVAGCDDAASAAWFQQALGNFALNYYDLLQQLVALPSHPRVIVNEYYVPLSAQSPCPGQYHLGTDQSDALLQRLAAFNHVLRTGAESFGFEAVAPSFTGHELCTAQPWVQGPEDQAPLHPNAAGEVAIALADQAAISAAPPSSSRRPSPAPS